MNNLKEILKENGVVLTDSETNELLKMINSDKIDENLMKNVSGGVQYDKFMTALKILAGVGVTVALSAGAAKLASKYKRDTSQPHQPAGDIVPYVAPNPVEPSKPKKRGVRFDSEVEVQEFNINTGDWGEGYIETISDTRKSLGRMKRKS